MKKSLFIILLLIWTGNIHAQILNVERERFEDLDTGGIWLGNMGFGFNLQQQQTRVITLSSTLNAVYVTPKNQLMFIANYENIQGEGDALVQNGYVHTRLNLGWKKKVTYELYTQAQFDEVRGINNRLLAGVSARIQPLGYDHANTTLAISPGLMFEHEDWSFENQDSVTNFLKTSTYIHLHSTLSDNIDLNWINYFQARLNALGKPRLSTEISLTFQFTESIGLSTQFSLLHDASPVVATDPLIYTWDNMLTISIDSRKKRKPKK